MEWFLGEKSLSAKVPINKEDFEIVGGILMGWEFDFGVWKWLKCLWNKGFDDMRYDKWFGMENLGFCLILLGIFDIDKVKFWRESVNESAIGLAAFPARVVSFSYPPVRQKEWIIDIY